jgi:hypothetical protein
LGLDVGAALAAFPGTDVVLPVVARIQGLGNPPSQFYSTLWLTNLSSTNTASLQLQFYQRDSASNPTASATLALAPRQTEKFDNCVETLFGISAVAGSLRVLSTEDVLVSTRTYNLPPGGADRDTTGQFFGAIPASFAIGAGDISELQGVAQTSEFRYNFGIVETLGQSVTVRATLRDQGGATIGSRDYFLPAHGQMQKNVTDITGAINGISNALLEITVVAGTGKILAYGTHNANVSQDGTGFEMAFKRDLLNGGTAGVSSLNQLKGDLTLVGGQNVTITPSADTLTIAMTGIPAGTLPPGTPDQTLRSNGSGWLASSALTNDGANVGISGNLLLPATTATAGQVRLGGAPFIHSYAGPGTDGLNTFVGI